MRAAEHHHPLFPRRLTKNEIKKKKSQFHFFIFSRDLLVPTVELGVPHVQNDLEGKLKCFLPLAI